MKALRIAAALAVATSLKAAGWEEFPGARLVASDFADGDSFQVEFDRAGEPDRQVVRLYFVDCPETSAGSDSDRRRVLEQMRHFGVADAQTVIAAGRQAAEFAAEALAEPFTVQTVFASALGRSRMPRVYARILTASGECLSALLVKNGLARAHGVGRALPEGISSSDYAARLQDMEAAAMMKRRGLWEHADPAKLVELREAARIEARALDAHFGRTAAGPVDVNSASRDELERIPGIGPVLAGRIVEARPFATIEELTTVQGISTHTLARLAEFLVADPPDRADSAP